jgi:hypothetical protein
MIKKLERSGTPAEIRTEHLPIRTLRALLLTKLLCEKVLLGSSR